MWSNAYAGALLLLVGIESALAVPEIPDSSLQDIAMASWYRGPLPGTPFYDGPVIYYNPSVVRSVGPELASFFKAHEYCHVMLNHIERANFSGDPYSTAWIRQGLELEADTCAVRVRMGENNPRVVRAALSFFINQGQSSADANHPPGSVRAQTIYNAAMQSRAPF